MSIVGISAGFHDAALSIVSNAGDILYAAHSERFSKIKSDASIDVGLASILDYHQVDHIAYYERPWAKQLRQCYSGQGIEWSKLTAKKVLRDQLGAHYPQHAKVSTHNHHLSHAAAGFQTSPYSRATVVVIDAIGEWDTISIYAAYYDAKGHAAYTKLWGQHYPHSIGLFYTAMTQQAGLKAVDEEYILMGMAGYSNPAISGIVEADLVADMAETTFNFNLHTGMPIEYSAYYNKFVIAASAQKVAEDLIYGVMERASGFNFSKNLVYMGGVALNCLANRRLGDYFDNIWIMPNPGDAGSSLGAAALVYKKKLNWSGPYLGHNIPGLYPVDELLNELLTTRIAGVANGPAEFGPRALGNRSLLADPRGATIKDRVNEIKRRQKFRPFAPVILEEHVDQFFDMPKNMQLSPYMQVVARCRNPELFPAIVHVDGTSRVQTVARDCASGIRQLLEAWYAKTGCPMLLNTSLNIRGEPVVNDEADAHRFEQIYKIRVFT